MVGSDHCLRCRGKTPNTGEGITKTKNGRMRRHSKCSGCGAGKSAFLPGGRGLSAGLSGGSGLSAGLSAGLTAGGKVRKVRGKRARAMQQGEGFWDDVWDGVKSGAKGAVDVLNTAKQYAPLAAAFL